MNIAFDTISGSTERPNEDWVTATPSAVVVLDGVTAPRGVEAGCHHGITWFVNQLGKYLLAFMENDDESISDSLAKAISRVGALHADTCVLAAPGTPAAAVAALRVRGRSVEYLVLADTSIVLDTTSGVTVVSDHRVENAAPEATARTREDPIGSPEHQAKVAHMSKVQLERRNTAGGYWVAASDPAAAEHAITGALPIGEVTRVAVLTDGASRAVDMFRKMDWLECLDFLQVHGPRDLIAFVRSIEDEDPDGRRWPRFKKSDDATAALARI